MTKPAALVTGGAKRIGAAMARALAANGWFVVIHYRASADEAALLAQELAPDCAALAADLSDPAAVESLVERAAASAGRPLSLLVNSASLFEHDSIDTMTRASWTAHVEANLWAPLKLAQDFARQAPDNAQIVNLIDQRVLRPTPEFLSYATTKAALQSLTVMLAQALGPKGVRVNAIAPGPTIRNARQTEAEFRAQSAATILGRGADPNDISEALLYLVGAQAVTGQMIAVDGGQHLQWRTIDQPFDK